ncbi:MAG: putative S-layer protein [Nanoarchaeota archaeon]
MTNKTNVLKFSTFLLLATVLLGAFASATVDFVGVSGSSQTVRQGSQAVISFKVEGTDFSGQFDNAHLILPSNVFSSTVWSGDTGSFTLLPNSNVSRTVVLSVPSTQTPGSYNAQISFAGDYNLSGTPVIHPLNIVLTVEAAQTIQLREKTAMTKSTNGVIEVENTGSFTLTNIQLSKLSGEFDVSFSENGFSLVPGQKREITVSPSNLGEPGLSGRSTTIRASSNGNSASLTLNVLGSFCSNGAVGGNLTIRSVDISNKGEGSEDEWKLLDEVEIEVDVKNNGNDNVDNVLVEIGLFDSTGSNQIGDLDFDNADEEQMDLGDLNDGDTDSVIFTFRIPADMEDGSYKLAVKAYSDDAGESEECMDTANDLNKRSYQDIDLQREDDESKFIAFENVEVSPLEVTCGESATLTADVFNIGDQDEDQVRVNFMIPDLQIKDSYEIKSNLDKGDNDKVDFSFIIPQNAQDKTYQIRLSADYDYRNGNYRESLDEFATFPLKVLGCNVQGSGSGGSGNTGRIASITANLVSDKIEPGKEAVVRATITNLKSTRSSFVIGASDYDSWSSLSGVSQRILDLDAGQSKDVTFTLKINDDSQGEQSFIIEALADGQPETREVALDISSASGTSFSFGNNGFIWVIGAVNLLLIILIIFVAVRISRR